MQPLLDVDVPGLIAVGKEVGAAGADIRAAAAEAQPNMAPSGQPGSDAAGIARTAATAWQTALDRLATDLETFGAQLTGAVRRIARTDDDNAAGIGRLTG